MALQNIKVLQMSICVLMLYVVEELLLNASLSFKDCSTYVKCFSSLKSSDADCEISYGTDPSVPELVTAPLNTMFQLSLLKPLTRYYFVFNVAINGGKSKSI